MASADDYAKWLVENEVKQGTPEFETVAQAYRLEEEREAQLKDNPNKDAVKVLDKFLGREGGFMKGYSDTAMGIGQLAEKMQGGPADPEIRAIQGDSPLSDQLKRGEISYQGNRILEGDEGIDWDRIAGNIVNPTTLAGATATVPAKLGGKVLQGMALGGGFAGAQPVYDDDYWSSKGMQVGTGMAVGTALPVVGAGAGKVFNKIAPYFSDKTKLAEKELSKDLSDLLGPQKEKVVDALTRYKSYVSQPTPSQAIAQATRASREAGLPDEFGEAIIRLSKDVSREPTVGSNMNTKAVEQAMARENLLKSIAGTEDDMAKAVSYRSEQVAPLYKAVEISKNQVDASPVLSKIDDFLALNKNERDIVAPLTQIRNKLVSGDEIESSPNALMSLSKEIKRLMGKTTDGKNAYNVKVLDEIKGVLDDQIGLGEGAYSAAQSKYKELSIPINRMKVGEELMKSLKSAQEKETAAPFLKAMQEAPRTLKKATGFARYDKLDDVLSLDQVDKIKRISQELLDQQKAAQMASGTRSVLPDVMSKESIRLPGILERNVVIANAILKKLETNKSPEYKEILSQLLNDPDKLAKALQAKEGLAKQVAMDIARNMTTIQGAQQSSSLAGAK